MDNPWRQLPSQPSFLLPDDRSIVEALQLRYSADSPWRLQLQLRPEPFVGHPDAMIYLLGLNPGYRIEADYWHTYWHTRDDFAAAIDLNLRHEVTEFPFYYLDPRFQASPGGSWWLKRLRSLIDATGNDLLSLSRQLMCVEFFPYHSHRYKRLPKSISPNGCVPSSGYSAELVRRAIASRKIIVAMRSFRTWCRRVPELMEYDGCYCLNSAQNVTISPRNLPQFERVSHAIIARK